MTAVSPEVIEKWSEEFNKAIWENDKPIGEMTPIQAAAWARRKSRQSAVIELPKRALPQDDQHDAGYNYCIDHAIELIESQGYRVEVKGD